MIARKLTYGNSVAIPAIAETKNTRQYREDSWLMSQSAANPSQPRKFLANREINREYSESRTFAMTFAFNKPRNSMVYGQIPDAAEQGINCADQGINFRGTGVNRHQSANF
ncbi:MAG: hypothetical protein ACREDM_07560 [Methylocella sp.]